MQLLFKLWFKVSWFSKTPIVIFDDRQYAEKSIVYWKSVYGQIKDKLLKWEPDIFDCDDFAHVIKAEFSLLKINGIGIVRGKTPRGFHCWNIILTDNGIRYMEPQTGSIFKKRKGWRAIAVIM